VSTHSRRLKYFTRAYVTRRARGGHLMDGFQILTLVFVGILAAVVYEMSKGVQGD